MRRILRPTPVSLQDLESKDETVLETIGKAIGDAFGHGGPGLILINGLRESYMQERLELLSAGQALGQLPRDALKKLEIPEIDYVVGWSCGREVFRGVTDKRKGSFYANPIYDDPSLNESELLQKYPFFLSDHYSHYMHRNLWPEDASCAKLESRFKSIGQYINHIALLIAHHCDRYIREHLEGNEFLSIENVIRNSRSAKGRLLHYFPSQPECNTSTSSTVESWCGFHNDHGMITGLISAAYFARGERTPLAQSPDEAAGLYVAPDEGEEAVKVKIPSDCLAFQIGEAAQIASGGILRATPHAVRATSVANISRVTLAVFLQLNPWDELPLPRCKHGSEDAVTHTSSRVPQLRSRYLAGDRFDDFALRTFRAYHHAS